MEVIGIVKDGKVELPTSVHLPDGAKVRVLVEELQAEPNQPLEPEPVSESTVLADIAWATGRRFDS